MADFEAAHAWYERFFGRPADNSPMEGHLVEWRVTDSGWVQVTFDAARAGSALLTDWFGKGLSYDGSTATTGSATS